MDEARDLAQGLLGKPWGDMLKAWLRQSSEEDRRK